jgi:hypothetical protein
VPGGKVVMAFVQENDGRQAEQLQTQHQLIRNTAPAHIAHFGLPCAWRRCYRNCLFGARSELQPYRVERESGGDQLGDCRASRL